MLGAADSMQLRVCSTVEGRKREPRVEERNSNNQWWWAVVKLAGAGWQAISQYMRAPTGPWSFLTKGARQMTSIEPLAFHGYHRRESR